MSFRVYQSDFLDPWRNLAAEEYLLDHLPPDEQALLLWRSRRAVVLGKHQNPWRESNPAALAAADIDLARRISGGGTVYQDLGNLNYCFILDRETYERDVIQALVRTAVERLDVPVELGPRAILTLHGRKFSGNAFCYRRQRVLHHGTLLVDTDLEALRRALVPVLPGVETKAIASVPSPVTNLSSARPELTVKQVADALVTVVELLDGDVHHRRMDDFPRAVLDELVETYRSSTWCFGRTPRFSAEGEAGDCRWRLRIDKGLIERVDLLTGRLPGDPSAVTRELVGKPFGEATTSVPPIGNWLQRFAIRPRSDQPDSCSAGL